MIDRLAYAARARDPRAVLVYDPDTKSFRIEVPG